MNNYPSPSVARVPSYRVTAGLPDNMTPDQNGTIGKPDMQGYWYLLPLSTTSDYSKLPESTSIVIAKENVSHTVMVYKYNPSYYISFMTPDLWETFTNEIKQVIKEVPSGCGCSGAGTSFRLGTI
jgi:hypothetical protein